MSSKHGMRKFGRGYVLDFDALMDEVRGNGSNQLQQSDHPTNTREDADSAPKDTTSPVPTTCSSSSAFNHSSPRHSSDSDTTQLHTTTAQTPSPTTEELPVLDQRMKRMPARMSVSRTGRCKNRDKTRMSVLNSTEFYCVNPSNEKKSNDKSTDEHHQHHSTSTTSTTSTSTTSTSTSGRSLMIATNKEGTSAELDSALSAIDTNVKQHIITDCYSF